MTDRQMLRPMSEARAITNLIGNGVATIVVSKWENALDKKRLGQVLNGESEDQADEPEDVSDGELVPADIPDMKSR